MVPDKKPRYWPSGCSSPAGHRLIAGFQTLDHVVLVWCTCHKNYIFCLVSYMLHCLPVCRGECTRKDQLLNMLNKVEQGGLIDRLTDRQGNL
jgi:hypothetical protein